MSVYNNSNTVQNDYYLDTLPKDNLFNILTFLDIPSIGAFCCVNSWTNAKTHEFQANLIQSSEFRQTLLDHAKQFAAELEDKALKHAENTERHAQQLKKLYSDLHSDLNSELDSDYVLSILQEEIKNDLHAAKQIVILIKNPQTKMQAYKMIDEAERTMDFEATKSRVYDIEQQYSKLMLSILREEIKINLPEAKRTAQLIKHPQTKMQAFYMILDAIAEKDLNAAETYISDNKNLLENETVLKNDVLLREKINNCILDLDLSYNSDVLEKLFSQHDILQTDITNIHLIAAEAKHNLASAKEKVLAITNPNVKMLAEFKIACALATCNPQAALYFTKSIENQELRDIALAVLAYEDNIDLRFAKEVVLCIADTELQAPFLQDIVKKEIKKHDLETAKQTIKLIQNSFKKTVALMDIETAEWRLAAQKDLHAAKQNALSMPSNDISKKNRALFAVVSEELKTDLEGAKKTTEAMSIPSYKNKALLEIIKEEIKIDPEGAKNTVESIDENVNPIIKAEAYQIIAIEEVKSSDLSSALSTFTTYGPERPTYKDKIKISANLQTMCSVAAQHDLKKAKEVVDKWEPIFKSIALCEFAKLEATRSPVVALETAQQIPDPTYKAIAILEIMQQTSTQKSFATQINHQKIIVSLM